MIVPCCSSLLKGGVVFKMEVERGLIEAVHGAEILPAIGEWGRCSGSRPMLEGEPHLFPGSISQVSLQITSFHCNCAKKSQCEHKVERFRSCFPNWHGKTNYGLEISVYCLSSWTSIDAVYH